MGPGGSSKDGRKPSGHTPEIPLVRVGRFGKALRMANAVKETKMATNISPPSSLVPSLASSSTCPMTRTGEAPDVAPKAMLATKRRRRESENAIAPGGLRTPVRYVNSHPKARQVGLKLAATIDAFIQEHPHVIEALLERGQEGRDEMKKSGEEEILARRIGEALGTKDTSHGPRSKWRAGIVEAYVRTAEDPDKQLAGWLRDGAPAGVAVEIEPSGIFPRIENAAEAHTELHKFYARTCGRRNYKSAEENAKLVGGELDRLMKEGYIEDYGKWEDVKAHFGELIISRLAAIIKTKADGSVKVRLIVDMLRSHVNAFVRLHERVVLPRLMDVVGDVVSMATSAPVTPQRVDQQEQEIIDLMGLDFADAFHSMGIDVRELPYQVFRVPGKDTYAGYVTVVFGGGGAGYVWSRGGALMGRSGQALFRPEEARIEIYVDDPLTIWRGTRSRIRLLKVRLLLWWMILGPEISWKKVQHGDLVKWIGANVQVTGLYSITLSLPDDYAEALRKEATACLALTVVVVTRIQSLAGMSAWVAGFIPAIGSMIAPLWAAISDCKAKRGGQPSAILVPIVRVRHSLRWIVAFATGAKGKLHREFKTVTHKAMGTISMEFDASPWGYGGVLFWQGRPWAYFAEPICQQDIERFGIVVGSCAFQALLETLAVLIGVRVWLPYWKDERLAVRVRSDSAAALGALRREKSKTASVNAVVRELALDLAEGLYSIDVKDHLPGKLNTWADPLSRLYQPDSPAQVPEGLKDVGRQAIPVRDQAWWRTSGDPLED